MKSTFAKPATLAALALCVVFSVILVNRIAGALGGHHPLPAATASGLELLSDQAAVTGMIEVRKTLDHGVFGLNRESLFPEDITTDVEDALDKLAEYTGVNPADDIDRVIFSFSDLENDADPTLIVQGNLNREKVVAFLTEKLGSNLTTQRHNGDAIYSVGDSPELFIAFPSDEIAIAARYEHDLERALDRHSSSIPRTVMSTEAFGPVAGSNAWISINSIQRYVSKVVEQNDHKVDERVALARRAVDGIMVGLDADDDKIIVTSAITPVESVSTDDLEDIVKGLVAAARTASRDHPDNPVVAEIIDRIKVRKNGEHVVVTLGVDRSDLEEAVKSFEDSWK